MNWVFITLVLVVVGFVWCIVGIIRAWGGLPQVLFLVYVVLIICFTIPLRVVVDNIEDKHDWYLETRLKYAEAEGIEKEYLEMTDVMTYNLWYAENKEDLENSWNFKSAAGCEFDYIKVGD
jgi:hypothetical protein